MLSAALCLLAVASNPPAPEPPTLSGDRPGFSYAASVVPPGHLQVELGVGASLGDAMQLSLPVASVRLGLFDGLEVQVALPSARLGDGEDGLGNIGVGVKVGRELSDAVAYSVVALYVASIGDRGVADPAGQFLAAANVEVYFLEDGWVSANTQVDSFSDAIGDRAVAVTPSLALGWTLADAFNPFVQGYARITEGEVRPAFGAGVAWLATRQLQLDLSVDYDVDAEAALLGGGVSWLW